MYIFYFWLFGLWGCALAAYASQTLHLGNSVTIINGVVVNQGNAASTDLVRGSGRMKQEKRALDAFSRLQLEIAATVIFTQGAAPSCVVSGDDNLLPNVLTQVVDGELRIATRSSFSTQNPLTLNITGPDLTRVVMTGAGEVRLVELDQPRLELVAEGSGSLSGSGQVQSLQVRLRGAGSMELFDLRAGTVEARLDGSGDIKVTATTTFSGVLDGSGDIRVRGPGRILRAEVRGAGEIKRD